MLWLWLLGCQTMGSLVPVSGPVGTDGTTSATSGTSTSTSPVVPVVSVTAEVVDPLVGAISWSVSGLVDEEGSLSIEGSDGVVYTDTYGATTKGSTGSWDGRLGDGSWAGLGRYTLRLTVAGQVVAETSAALVRAGLTTAYAEDDDGLTSRRVDMYWWEDSTRQSEGYAITGLEQLEDADTQTPLPFAPVSDELRVGQNIQGTQRLAYTFDSRPLLTIEVGGPEDTFFGATGLDAVALRVEAAGWTVQGDGLLSDDGLVTLMRDAPLSEEGTVGVTEELVTFSFVHDAKNGPQVVGTQTLPLMMYRVLGPATFGHSGERYTAWAEALDELLPFIEGTSAEHDAVANAVVDYVYHETGLEYDTRRGASAYSDYDWGWDPHVYFSDFLDRRFGTTINCTDAGNLVTTYANMVGAELRHLIILENFSLDEIKAIGIEEYTSCPFGPGGCGFSYHAVTTDDGGDTIWDATLALDGDDDPGSAPHEVMMVQAIDGEEYLNRLVRDDFAYYDYENEGTIQ